MRNFDLKPPYKQTSFYLTSLLAEQSWSKAELLDVAARVTPRALVELAPALMTRLHVEGLVHGNVTRSGALALVQELEDKLAKQGPIIPLKPRQLLRGRELQLCDGELMVHVQVNF